MNERDTIQRYSDGERINHWIVAISFVLAALSGLSMFHPALFWLSHLFGGGPWTRILHPFIGAAMAVAFVSLASGLRRRNRLRPRDKQWLKQWRDVVGNREQDLPEVGKYNGGQKLMFWLMVACVILPFVTGILFGGRGLPAIYAVDGAAGAAAFVTRVLDPEWTTLIY